MEVPSIKDSGPVGAGAKRAVAFGGGGVWFIAWMLGYATGLREGSVDLSQADVTVGTSAGSVVGAAIKSGRLDAMTGAFEALGSQHGTLTGATGAPSQLRAQKIMAGTTAITAESLQAIGRAAMASRNSPVADHKALLHTLIGSTVWPGGHYTTATDCYTGESLLVNESCGLSIEDACSASSSLPGAIGPTWLGDRLCMDGGVSHSSTHAEVLQGASFVLILGMFDFKAAPPEHVNPSFGLAERVAPGTAGREAAALHAAGSTVHVAIAAPDPDTDFLSPATIAPAFAVGKQRGIEDAATISPHWH